MAQYNAPLRDLQFVLHELLNELTRQGFGSVEAAIGADL